MTNPDNSGMLRFLTDELHDAEDAGDKGQLIHLISETFIEIFDPYLSLASLDPWTCVNWLGWHQPITKSDQLVCVFWSCIANSPP